MANFVKNMDDFGIVKYFTIESTDWNTTNKTYTIEDNLITVGENESAQFISYNPALYDDARYEELCKAAIRINSVSNGQIVLKCTGILPTSTQYLMVTFKATNSPSIFTIDGAPIDGSQNPISSGGVYNALEDIYSGGRYYWAGEDIGYDSTVYNSSISLNVNSKAGMATLRLYGQAAKALSSGTGYTVATIPSNVKEIVGQHYVRGVGASTAANTVVIVTFNTWEDNSYIEITPRGAISSGNSIVATLTWPI